MKRKTINSEMQEKWQRIVAYLDSFPLARDLGQARLASLRELQSPTLRHGDAAQSAGGKELRRRRTLMPSILDKTFRGEL
jgi:hypothetical protein